MGTHGAEGTPGNFAWMDRIEAWFADKLDKSEASSTYARAIVRTNRADDPSFTSVTGWAGATITLGTDGGYIGATYLRATAPGAGGIDVGKSATVYPVTAGQVVTVSARVRGTVGRTALMQLVWTEGGVGSTAATPLVSETVFTTAWATVVVPAGKTGFYVDLWCAVSAGEHVDFDALMIEDTDRLGPYFDGSTSDTATLIHGWTGTPDASSSTEIGLPIDAAALGVNVQDYGAKGDGTTDDTSAMIAAALACPAGGVVYVPPTSAFYEVTSDLPWRSDITWMGGGTGSEIRVTSGSLFKPTGLTLKVRFIGLALKTYGGHLIDLGTTGYVSQSSFTDCLLATYVNGSSLVNGSGACGWQEVIMNGCDLIRAATATVPAFNLVSSGSNLNISRWSNSRASSGNGGTTPFWHMEMTGAGAANGISDCKWDLILGEQNPAGLIEIWSPFGFTLQDVVDYDTTTYTASLVKIHKGPGSCVAPSQIKLSNVGNRGGTMGAGVYHVEVLDAPSSPLLLDRVSDGLGVQKVSVPAGSTYTPAVPPTCRLTTTVAQNTAATPYDTTAVQFNVETYDPTNMHDNSTNNTRVTVPMAGYYRLKGKLRTTTNTPFATMFQINGAPHAETESWAPFAVVGDVTIDTTLFLDAGSYVELLSESNSASAVIAPGGCYFEVAFVRP